METSKARLQEKINPSTETNGFRKVYSKCKHKNKIKKGGVNSNKSNDTLAMIVDERMKKNVSLRKVQNLEIAKKQKVNSSKLKNNLITTKNVLKDKPTILKNELITKAYNIAKDFKGIDNNSCDITETERNTNNSKAYLDTNSSCNRHPSNMATKKNLEQQVQNFKIPQKTKSLSLKLKRKYTKRKQVLVRNEPGVLKSDEKICRVGHEDLQKHDKTLSTGTHACILKKDEIENNITPKIVQRNVINSTSEAEAEKKNTIESNDDISLLFSEDQLSASYIEKCLDLVETTQENFFTEKTKNYIPDDLRQNESKVNSNSSPKVRLRRSDRRLSKLFTPRNKFKTRNPRKDTSAEMEVELKTKNLRNKNQNTISPSNSDHRDELFSTEYQNSTIPNRMVQEQTCSLEKSVTKVINSTSTASVEAVSTPVDASFSSQNDTSGVQEDNIFFNSIINCIEKLLEALPKPNPSYVLDNFQLYIYRKTRLLSLKRQQKTFYDPSNHASDFFPADEHSVLMFNKFYEINKGNLWFEIDERSYICLICDKKLPCKTTVINHLNRHYRHYFVCKFCTTKLSSVKSFKEHNRSSHAQLK